MSLRCEEVRDRFSALWENELTLSDQAEIKGHLDLCVKCREEFARFDRTLRLLHSVEEVDVPEGFLTGVHEKLEERKSMGLTPSAKGSGWLNLSPRMKLPIQAVAMVGVVFLALYFTKMTPVESPQTKSTIEPKSALTEEKKTPAAVQTPVPKEENLDQLSLRQRENRVKEEETLGSLKEKAKVHTAERESRVASDESGTRAPEPPATAPSNLPATPAPPLREKMKSPSTFPGKPAKMPEKGEALPHPEEKVSEGKVDFRTGVRGTPSASGPKADESLQGSRLTAKKAEEASGAGGTLSSEIKPSQELVLKVKDQKGTLPHLEELTKQVQGVIVNAAKDNLLISLPKSSLPEFRNELEKIGSVKEKVPPERASKETGAIPEQTPVEKRREAKGKDKEADHSSVAKEDQVLIRIDLIEE